MENSLYTGVTKPRPEFGYENWDEHDIPVKRFKKYVFATNKNGCLIHKIEQVKARWWDYDYYVMLRRVNPHLMATTICGLHFSLTSTKAKTCDLPAPDAVLCGRCHGEAVNFPRGKEHKVSKELAKIRKGCMERGE